MPFSKKKKSAVNNEQFRNINAVVMMNINNCLNHIVGGDRIADSKSVDGETLS